MSIVVAEVRFYYTDEDWGEAFFRVRAAFRTWEAAEAWAEDKPARLAQAREEWDETFELVPAFDPACEYLFSEIPLYD